MGSARYADGDSGDPRKRNREIQKAGIRDSGSRRCSPSDRKQIIEPTRLDMTRVAEEGDAWTPSGRREDCWTEAKLAVFWQSRAVEQIVSSAVNARDAMSKGERSHCH